MRSLASPVLAVVLTSCHVSGPIGDVEIHLPDADTDSASADGDADADDTDALEDADVEGDTEIDADPELECGYPADGYGLRPGSVLEPFRLRGCDGSETSLPRLWCGHAATIVHFGVAWCGSCMSSTNELLNRVLPELEGESVTLVEIVLEDNPGEVADLELCTWWHDYFEPDVTTYIPPDGVIDGLLRDVLWYEPMPFTIVLDSEGRIRIWAPVVLPLDLADQIRALL
jgi:hypothetical protein